MATGSATSIFLAEDDPDDCFLFRAALLQIPIVVNLTVSHDGVELMDRLDNTPELKAIFLDLNMPLKSGFQCLEEIKRTERLKELDVVILSTSFSVDVARQLLSQGARSFFQKPTDLATLTRYIEDTLNMVEKH